MTPTPERRLFFPSHGFSEHAVIGMLRGSVLAVGIGPSTCSEKRILVSNKAKQESIVEAIEEIRLLESLQHENIVAYLGCDEGATAPCGFRPSV